MVTYAAFAFAHSLTKKQTAKLNSVQSLALRLTCNARRGTPLNGLEIILDVPPIDLFMKAEAAKSAFRLIGTNDESSAQRGHLAKAQTKLRDLGLFDRQPDKIDKQLLWDKKYSTHISKLGFDIEQGFRCYTDGSKTKDGLGAGFCIIDHEKVKKTRAFPMQNHTTYSLPN